MGNYEDILHHTRYELKKHRPMPIASRAAQFSAFAALTGFDEKIDETARLTEAKQELSEEQLEQLNRILVRLSELETRKPLISVTYFQKDERKNGGAYLHYTGNLRFLDEAERKLKFVDGTVIAVSELYSIRIHKAVQSL